MWKDLTPYQKTLANQNKRDRLKYLLPFMECFVKHGWIRSRDNSNNLMNCFVFDNGWVENYNPDWTNPNFEYEIPVIYNTVHWNKVPKRYDWVTVDNVDNVTAWENEPYKYENFGVKCWHETTGGAMTLPKDYVDRGTVSWELMYRQTPID